MKVLSDAEFASRRRIIQSEITTAKKLYGDACSANAVGMGSDAEQREAKDALDFATDKLTALDAAWEAAIAQRRQAEHETKIAEFEVSGARVEQIALQAVSAAEDLPALIDQVRGVVAAYGAAYSAIQAECRGHKLDLSGHRPGDLVGSAVAEFNRSAGSKRTQAETAIGALVTLQNLVSELPFEGREAMKSFRPKEIERECA